ncbi:MAG: hypothetical protein NVSMB38_42700 [Ktedonobacteraceae bacterium]
MECPYCKADNRDGVRYCGSCGKLLSVTMPAPLATGGNSGGTISGNARSLTPGSRLQGGRYVIKKVLGGMGAALLAIDIRLNSKLVVIKELVSNNTDPNRLQDDVRNFKREVATLAHIDHPLVPNVTDHFQEGPRYFMVQEYVEGDTLEERIEHLNQPMRERDALVYASEILDVLDYLTQQTPPIVHRDVKPANIVIGAKDQRAHLVDFGIARADEAKNAQRKQTSALGTPGYAPPEQYQGNADPRSDLYALAATLHHLLTNRDPRNYAPFIYPAARTLNPQLSPEIENVLIRTLQNDLKQRYQSAAAMKKDIDDILLKHFGVSGAGNSYVLGGSGPMLLGTMPLTKTSGTVPAVPIGATGATYPSYLPVGGSQQNPPYLVQNPPSQPGNVSPYQGYSKPRKRRTGLYISLLLLLLLLIAGSTLAAFYLLPHGQTSNGKSTPTATNSSNGIGVTKLGNDEIGVSDGSFIFDTARPDGTLKRQAANQLKQKSGDTSGVIAALSSALEQEPHDAEAHIYLEDQRVISSGSPYVTLVIGTMLSDDTIGIGRDDLQGAYIAQKEFNDGSKLSGDFKVRLLIANSGSKAAYASNVAKQIVQLAMSDKTFVGVMGWPFSSHSVDAIRVLSAAHIPMVSQTSSSDDLTHISPYFFRVAPSNNIQGVSGAKYAEQTLHASSAALFVDPADTYSQSLAKDFRTQFEGDRKKIVVTEEYTVGKTSNFSALLQDALKYNPTIIYFSGYAADISTLLTDLPPGNTISVMGGDALYELNGYQSSARAGFTHLRFTAFAYPDEWDVLGQTAKKPTFFADYAAAFSPNKARIGYGYTRPDNDVTLSYDATVALLDGCNSALRGGKTQITAEDLRQALTKTTFQGVSGQISFGPNGDPLNKAIVILAVDSLGQIRMELPVLGQFFK